MGQSYVKYAFGVVSRGIKRLPERLRPPAPPFETPPLTPDTFRVAVYFADAPVNMYQMRQWYAPLRHLHTRFPVVVISRDEEAARLLIDESGLEVTYAPRIEDIERLLQEQPIDIVFYVNQNARNFQMMRYATPAHVFINHGESEKAYMVSAQHKAYDYAFVAGEAAKSRLAQVLWGYDVDARTFAIGRPQLDSMFQAPPYPVDSRKVVFYAPTWEGDRPSMSYGSVHSHGVRLIRYLLNNPKYRVIYRPHPRSGVMLPEYDASNREIQAMIEEANLLDPHACHIFDTDEQLTWQLTETDLVICDISAMLYDRLATAKPLIVTRPASSEAEIRLTGFLEECEWLDVEDLDALDEKILKSLTDPGVRQTLRQWSEYYFGDVTPGAATRRFEAAVETLLVDAAQRRERRESDKPIR